MKKTTFILAFIVSFSLPAYSQLKHDFIWTIGYGEIFHHPLGYTFGGIIMDFNVSPPSLTLQDYVIDSPLSTISSKSGQLVAYTDGCRILNCKHQIMLDGDTLNPGVVFDEFCSITSYPLWQPTIFLPKPGSDSFYYLFHLRSDNVLWNPVNLMYSVIDASGDNGDGVVISKNNSILSDSIFLGNYVTATRHGNGQDWWIVTPRRFNYNIHVSLLTSKGVEYKGMQEFNIPKIDSTCCSSQTAFSPDGSKYFRNSHKGLLVLNFDRCTGILSNPVYLDWNTTPFGGAGVAVSPNSRFLYLTSGGTVQQYDLWASNLAASMQVVAVYDGTVAFGVANFFQMTNGPDGKIYINTSHSNDVLHVIHSPNELGVACNVEQHAIHLPALSDVLMPNFANYNLGPLDPPCDSTSNVGLIAPRLPSQKLLVSPNPTTGLIEAKLPVHDGGILSVYNSSVQKVKTLPVAIGNTNMTLDFGPLTNGLYWIVFSDASGKLDASAKVTVLH